jgi:poly [ADP-ribose] polymerase 2/3/4
MLPSKLDPSTQELMDLIYSRDMFNNALKTFDLDVKKMPLGKISKTQIAKGFEVLEEIEQELNGKTNFVKICELSSKFYTIIPQDFGRLRPPPITSAVMLQQKYDMLTVLGDIELAQSLQEESKKSDGNQGVIYSF